MEDLGLGPEGRAQRAVGLPHDQAAPIQRPPPGAPDPLPPPLPRPKPRPGGWPSPAPDLLPALHRPAPPPLSSPGWFFRSLNAGSPFIRRASSGSIFLTPHSWGGRAERSALRIWAAGFGRSTRSKTRRTERCSRPSSRIGSPSGEVAPFPSNRIRRPLLPPMSQRMSQA